MYNDRIIAVSRDYTTRWLYTVIFGLHLPCPQKVVTTNNASRYDREKAIVGFCDSNDSSTNVMSTIKDSRRR